LAKGRDSAKVSVLNRGTNIKRLCSILIIGTVLQACANATAPSVPEPPDAAAIDDAGIQVHLPRYTEQTPNRKGLFSQMTETKPGLFFDASMFADAQEQRVDASTTSDASTELEDAGPDLDAGLFLDAGSVLDTGPVQNFDSGLVDAEFADASLEDTGAINPDASSPIIDAGTPLPPCLMATSTSSPFQDATGCLSTLPVHNRQFGYLSTGQAWGDFDNDGWPDLYVASHSGANTLYRNQGDGTFAVSIYSSTVALATSRSGGAVFADYNNDGFKDLYVVNYGANVLFRNDQGNGFTDVTSTANVGDIGKGTTAAWGDYDNDGLLDLFVANHDCPECVQPPGVLGARDRLYKNNGQGQFTDVSLLLGINNTIGYAFAASFLDFDNDGDLDIYVANDRGYSGPQTAGTYAHRNVLYRNNGAGCGGWCFVEVGTLIGADSRVDGMGLAIGDYDNDGDLDIYCTHTGNPVLLQNNGSGRFTDVAGTANATYFSVSWGTFFFDYDNDTDLDLYVAIGLEFWGLTGNRLFQNLGNGNFNDVTAPLQLGHTGETLGAAYADYDKDGLVDFVVGNWGSGFKLYRNATANSGNWIRYRLVGGPQSNRDAIGARVSIGLDDGQRLMQEVKSGSSLGAGNDTALHFGLGTATATSVEIRWPNGDLYQLSPHPPNQEVVIQQ